MLTSGRDRLRTPAGPPSLKRLGQSIVTRSRERKPYRPFWSAPAAGRLAGALGAGRSFPAMTTLSDPRAAVAQAVSDYQATADTGALFATLDQIAGSAMPDALIAAAEPYRTIPEVAGPLYEKVVEAQPTNARALVILANAYWLSGRGPVVVGELAQRAIAADPSNRGGWHLWALSESDPRDRTTRWQQIVERFPDDELAMANLADNAAALAGAEKDYDALDLAVYTYERLLERATMPEQRDALDSALRSLRGWKF
jgi:hypothetical protein